jgi:hypothetical protein
MVGTIPGVKCDRDPAERPQANRIAINADDHFAVRVRFECDVTAEPGGNRLRHNACSLHSGRTQAGDAPQVWGKIGLSSYSNNGRSNNPSLTGTS